MKRDGVAAGLRDDGEPVDAGGTGASAYADAVAVYLGLGVSKLSDYNASLVSWSNSRDQAVHVFGRQAVPMVWDYAEVSPFADAAGDLAVSLDGISRGVASMAIGHPGVASQRDAQTLEFGGTRVVSTDPPYYDNINYADLSDYFYIWLRRSLKPVFPDLFATLAVPKAEELVATPYRHGGKEKAEAFFLDGMTQAMHHLVVHSHPAFPVTIYYAYKQSESDGADGTASTGWESFLDAAIRAGFSITGTWPMRTERQGRMVGNYTNSLASSIILVCRPRAENAALATRREFVTELKRELPGALRKLQQGNIAPVDMAQASIGPGMAVFSRYGKVIEAEGSPMSVRAALQLINSELESFLKQEEGEADRDTQFCISWFEQYGITSGPFGEADVLARAKNVSVDGMVRAGVIASKGGKVALLPRTNYPSDWDPITDPRLTLWECAQQLIKRHLDGGEAAAAALVARLGPGRSEDAKTLAYRLYMICERKGWSEEALAYNEFVVAWPEILKKAAAITGEGPQKTFEVEEKK